MIWKKDAKDKSRLDRMLQATSERKKGSFRTTADREINPVQYQLTDKGKI